MKHGLKAAVLSICTLLAPQTFAQPLEQTLMTDSYGHQESLSKNVSLPPGDPLVITNPLTVALMIDCTVLNIGEQEEVTIAATVLKKAGSVNGIEFSADESVRMPIAVDETFQIVAEPGSQVSLTNEGDFNVTARCSGKIKPND